MLGRIGWSGLEGNGQREEMPEEVVTVSQFQMDQGRRQREAWEVECNLSSRTTEGP